MPFSKIGRVTHPVGTHLSQISRAASHPYTAVALMAKMEKTRWLPGKTRPAPSVLCTLMSCSLTE